MKTLKVLATALFSLAGTGMAHAGTISGVITVIELYIVPGGGYPPSMTISISGGSVTVPLAACNTTTRFAIDMSTPQGAEAARFAQLLYVSGRPARLLTNGQCNVYPSTETVIEVDGA